MLLADILSWANLLTGFMFLLLGIVLVRMSAYTLVHEKQYFFYIFVFFGWISGLHHFADVFIDSSKVASIVAPYLNIGSSIALTGVVIVGFWSLRFCKRAREEYLKDLREIETYSKELE